MRRTTSDGYLSRAGEVAKKVGKAVNFGSRVVAQMAAPGVNMFSKEESDKMYNSNFGKNLRNPKAALSAATKIPGAMVGAAKSGMVKGSVDRKLTRELTNQIGPEGTVGAKNYDAHNKAIRGLLNKNDINGANAYVKKQKSKM